VRGPALAAVLAAAGLLAACGDRTRVEPPEIHYGQDVCSACGMIVSEERFASAAVVEDAEGRREALIFDDLGCMMGHLRRLERGTAGEEAGRVLARFVRGYAGTGWVEAEEAAYVRSDEIPSPMGSGLAAVRDSGGADELLDRYPGRILSYTELREIEASEGLLAPPPARRTQSKE
jgi:copper chaperone NosL